MPGTPFSTTRVWVVARGQYVRLEFDLLDGKEQPKLWPGAKLTQQSYLTWLDSKTALYHAEGNHLLTSDPFDLTLGLGSWTRESGVNVKTIPGFKYDQFKILIGDEYRQTPAQQAREAVLPTGGADPQVAVLQAKIDAALKALA